MSYQANIPKEVVNQLSEVKFNGNIVVIDRLEQVDQAIAVLSQSPEIGFDTETRPTFVSGKRYNVALIQLSTRDVCFLFRTNIIGLPEALIGLLENKDIKKIGLSVNDDLRGINRLAPVNVENFIELQRYVSAFGINEMSLQRIYAIIFNKKISKSQQLSNWENIELTLAQQNYAAIDAWACLEIYLKLREG